MTEIPSAADQEGRPGAATAPQTGVALIDGVLEDVRAASALPADEQVAVLERAHERLRAALDDTA